jgi:hypothetical protein
VRRPAPTQELARVPIVSWKFYAAFLVVWLIGCGLAIWLESDDG